MNINPNMDGIDHINIYSKGRTSIGRFLSNFAQADIETDDGDFASIEGYWYWLLLPMELNSCSSDISEDDISSFLEKKKILHSVFGYDAKNIGKRLLDRYGRRLTDEQVDNDIDFKSKIKNAIKFKINNHPKYKKELLESTLPFNHYYIFYGKIKEPTSHRWVIDYMDELRK